jgi:hypothetical protein
MLFVLPETQVVSKRAGGQENKDAQIVRIIAQRIFKIFDRDS